MSFMNRQQSTMSFMNRHRAPDSVDDPRSQPAFTFTRPDGLQIPTPFAPGRLVRNPTPLIATGTQNKEILVSLISQGEDKANIV